jgi:hypothetical protein
MAYAETRTGKLTGYWYGKGPGAGEQVAGAGGTGPF